MWNPQIQMSNCILCSTEILWKTGVGLDKETSFFLHPKISVAIWRQYKHELLKQPKLEGMKSVHSVSAGTMVLGGTETKV